MGTFVEHNPYAPPESDVGDAAVLGHPSRVEERRQGRGGCLTSLLVVIAIGSAWMIPTLFTASPSASVASRYPRLTVGLVRAYGVVGLLNIVLVVLVWRWRRVGVYGFATLSLAILAVNLYIGASWTEAVSGLTGPLMLVLLARQRWSQFR